MDPVEARRVLARLRELRARYDQHDETLTVRGAADELALPKTSVHRLVGRWHRRPRRLGKATRARLDEMLAAGVADREIARRLSIGRGTIQRRRVAKQLASGDLVHCLPWRCPVGGELLDVTRCIAHGVERPPAPERDSGPGS